MLLVILAGAGAYAYHSATQPYVQLHPVAASRASAQQAQAKIDKLSQALSLARSSGQPQPVSQTFTDSELTSLADQDLSGSPISNLILHSSSAGYIEGTGTATLAGQSFPLYLRASIVISGGEPALHLSDVRLGSMSAPSALVTQIEAALHQSLVLSQSGLSGLKVAFGNGEVTISGAAEP